MNSKIVTAIAVVLLGAFNNIAAQDSATLENGVKVTNAGISSTKGGVKVVMDIDFSDAKVKSNHAIYVKPAIAGAKDTLILANLSSLGRKRYFYNLRNSIEMPQGEVQHTWRKSETPETWHLDVIVPFEAWMNGARLMVNECVLGCCNKTLDENWTGMNVSFTIPAVPDFKPVYVFRKPKAELVKTGTLQATSYVDFPVSRIEIYPEYRKNPRELARIVHTIDSVRHDSDITIQHILLKGFASPESPYGNNYRLAKGRTNSIKRYISSFNYVNSEIIDTDFEPENWAGLRAFVEASDISNKEGILKIIDRTDVEPDHREDILKIKYPQEYAYLKAECYPALRKVDYTIFYEIRKFVTVEEIMRAYKSDPGKLSKDEFFMLASSLDESDPLHDILLKDAVKAFPNDPATNLNAANVAMKEGRLYDAGHYLDKAGSSHEAQYARGVYSALQKDYGKAAEYFEQVKETISEAASCLDQVQTIMQLESLWKF